jgi:hypothetical protein
VKLWLTTDGLRFISAAQLTRHPKTRVCRQLVVFGGLRQKGAERPRDPLFGGRSVQFGQGAEAMRRHHLAEQAPMGK